MKGFKLTLHGIVIGFVLWFTGIGIAGATVINVSLNPTDWEADPLRTSDGSQSPNQSKFSTADGLKVENDQANGGTALGAYVRTVNSFNVQNATIRYKWKATAGAPSYANYWNGHDKWTFGAQMTTGWSWASSYVIPLDTWIFAEAFVGDDLSYYYNFSTTGYASSGGFRSGSGTTTNQTWFDSLSDVHLVASVNDNYSANAGFVINEMSLTTPDQQTVPEPGSLLLMLLSLAGLGFKKNKVA